MYAEDLRVRMKTHTAEFGLSKKLNTCDFEEQRISKKEEQKVSHLRSGDRDDGPKMYARVLVVAVGSLLAQEAPGIRGVVRELCPTGVSHEDVRISGTKCTDGDGTGF